MSKICEPHGIIRCWECEHVRDLEEENQRLREALEEIIELERRVKNLPNVPGRMQTIAQKALKGDYHEHQTSQN